MTPPNERIVVFETPYSSGGFVVNKPARHAQCMLLYLVLAGNSARFWISDSYTLFLPPPVLMRSCTHGYTVYTPTSQRGPSQAVSLCEASRLSIVLSGKPGDEATRAIAGARAPVCPSLATPLLLARDTVEDISFHTSSSRLYDSALEKSKPIYLPPWSCLPTTSSIAIVDPLTAVAKDQAS